MHTEHTYETVNIADDYHRTLHMTAPVAVQSNIQLKAVVVHLGTGRQAEDLQLTRIVPICKHRPPTYTCSSSNCHLNYAQQENVHDIPVTVCMVHSGQYDMNIIFDTRLPGLGFQHLL